MKRILGNELPQFCAWCGAPLNQAAIAWLASGKTMHDEGVSHGVCKPFCPEVMRQVERIAQERRR